MRRIFFVGAMLVTLAAVPDIGSAQTDEDAHYVRDVGAGLTLGGIATTGLGVGLMLGLRDVSGSITGGVFAGIGGLLGVVGVPTWIVGGVRSDVLSHPESERGRVGWSYELAGIVITLSSIGACLVGGALLAAAYGLSTSSQGPADDQLSRAFVSAGGAMVPIATYIAMFLGVPIWAEGARF